MISKTTNNFSKNCLKNKKNINYYITNTSNHENSTILGFWLYLMSDCLIFSSLFAIYAVLGHNYAEGPTAIQIFKLPSVALNTIILLLSSLSCGFAIIQAQKKYVNGVIFWLSITTLLGFFFVILELNEFIELINRNFGPWRSAFLSSFFVLVGMHGLHIIFGIIWLITLILQIKKYNLILENQRRIICLSMFWHFLDIIWIGIFTFIYLIGTLS
ncbi:cytochrome o ubiquinol oxidase subunit III [Candidatus Profftella armatura]|uniref:cytochrome o ubiquinol oxidase subunit III n=1 Tax=Candidatus Profftella armatura TaxID=669502 RepID=UPI0015DBD2C6|nr:cytochrome o ubiquinol oxidase subunit III [Candidatus Profftella armatura]QLK13786.1 cytochrome o ubiquinol oxidase subunit III [Candidatus Profftella armatura]